MKIAIGADHAGYLYKEKLKKFLTSCGHKVIDCGTFDQQLCDYPDFARKVALQVAHKKADRGVLLCGTGNGMAIAANKINGIRACVCYDNYTAEFSRRHNNANIFCAGARTNTFTKIKNMLILWLKTPFEGNRHRRRINKIRLLEKNPF